MVEIVGVRFRKAGKIYYFDPKGLQLSVGTKVIVETVRGLEIGDVVIANRMEDENRCFLPLSPVIRAATEEDLKRARENEEKEKEALRICEEKAKKRNPEMTLMGAEYTFDGSKVIFSFVADGRVDFRDLLKDLASVFKVRIELRQIGVRDETKIKGGLGVCGKKVCCAQFLSEFSPVSVRMAKDQSLSTNPQKISGTCGKLICCLNYEDAAYEEAYKTMPRVGQTVKTPDGLGVVAESNILIEKIRVKFDIEGQITQKIYDKEDIVMLDNGKKSEKSSKNESEEEISEEVPEEISR